MKGREAQAGPREPENLHTPGAWSGDVEWGRVEVMRWFVVVNWSVAVVLLFRVGNIKKANVSPTFCGCGYLSGWGVSVSGWKRHKRAREEGEGKGEGKLQTAQD